MQYVNSIAYAQKMDQEDPLNHFRDRFYIPKVKNMPGFENRKDLSAQKEVIYFCGNSLGLQPKTVRDHIEQEIKDWEQLAIEAHFNGKNPWYYYHHFLNDSLARLVGANKQEVVAMNSLTVNLHLMLVSFYRPTQKRFKILVESGAFPSDQYAFESQVSFHGFNPNDAIVELVPRKGEFTLQTNDIIETIHRHQDELSLIILGGVNYYTGQAFDMKAITTEGHNAGAVVGFDLAHAIGNLKLQLHSWDVDFAVWCSYKYLNSGPGGVAGAFVHERNWKNLNLPRFAGWWGYDENKRFLMEKGFSPQPGAAGWQLSNAPVFPMAVQAASLKIFDEAGVDVLSLKRDLLTGYLEFLLNEINNTCQSNSSSNKSFDIITPKNNNERGCQLSLLIRENGKKIYNEILQEGIFVDWREPQIMRIAPVPLYNRFEEIFHFVNTLKKKLKLQPVT